MSEYIYTATGEMGRAERETPPPTTTATAPVDTAEVLRLVRDRGAAIQKALEDFYTTLDTLAYAQQAWSTHWVRAVEYVTGDVLEGYSEWVSEAWA